MRPPADIAASLILGHQCNCKEGSKAGVGLEAGSGGAIDQIPVSMFVYVLQPCTPFLYATAFYMYPLHPFHPVLFSLRFWIF